MRQAAAVIFISPNAAEAAAEYPTVKDVKTFSITGFGLSVVRVSFTLLFVALSHLPGDGRTVRSPQHYHQECHECQHHGTS